MIDASSLVIGKSYLITTDNWFFAPDGKQYRAVFGVLNGIPSDKDTLGIKTNRGSTNWYVDIGGMLIAGCQIHYAMRTESVNLGCHMEFTEEIISGDGVSTKKEVTEKIMDPRIYHAKEKFQNDKVSSRYVLYSENGDYVGKLGKNSLDVVFVDDIKDAEIFDDSDSFLCYTNFARSIMRECKKYYIQQED